MLKIAFIGVGGISKKHIDSLNRLNRSEFVGFCDVVEERARKAADGNGGSAYTDFNKMLDRERPDAVFICTPPFVRVEPITAAASRGIAIFSEKPPAFDAEQGRAALEAIQKAGVINSVGFMYRWLKTVNRAKELMAGKKLSAICSVFLSGPAVNLSTPAWFFIRDKSGGR